MQSTAARSWLQTILGFDCDVSTGQKDFFDAFGRDVGPMPQVVWGHAQHVRHVSVNFAGDVGNVSYTDRFAYDKFAC